MADVEKTPQEEIAELRKMVGYLAGCILDLMQDDHYKIDRQKVWTIYSKNHDFEERQEPTDG